MSLFDFNANYKAVLNNLRKEQIPPELPTQRIAPSWEIKATKVVKYVGGIGTIASIAFGASYATSIVPFGLCVAAWLHEDFIDRSLFLQERAQAIQKLNEAVRNCSDKEDVQELYKKLHLLQGTKYFTINGKTVLDYDAHFISILFQTTLLQLHNLFIENGPLPEYSAKLILQYKIYQIKCSDTESEAISSLRLELGRKLKINAFPPPTLEIRSLFTNPFKAHLALLQAKKNQGQVNFG